MKKWTAVLLTLCLLCPIPGWGVSGNAGDGQAGLAFILTEAAYVDDGNGLALRGVFINATRFSVRGVRTLRLTLNGRDGFVLARTLQGGGLDRLLIPPGGVRAWETVLDSPIRGKDLSRLDYNVDCDRINGQEAVLPRGIRVFCSGRPIHYDVPPALVEGRTLIPARQTFEAMGAAVLWDEARRLVTVTRGDRVVEITLDKSQMRVNGTAVQLDAPARILDGRTLIPLRAVASALGSTVTWGDEDRMVVIADV